MALKLLVTGGGTGGHVFPALETALEARKGGAEVTYYGSLRGQEGEACRREEVEFRGFTSEPLYRLYSLQGMKSALKMLRAVTQIIPAIDRLKPDVVFATGGYSSAPVLHAAKKRKIPTVLHEQNSVPGRTLLMASKWAHAVCTVFHASEDQFPGAKVVRTGMPVRAVFRQQTRKPGNEVLVVGGSQGSASLNLAAMMAASDIEAKGLKLVHVTGRAFYESTKTGAAERGQTYRIEPYLTGEEMAELMSRAYVAVCRSGAGTIAELAVMGLPSVLIPYPYAFGGHQLANAKEIVSLGAATLLEQSDLDDPSRIVTGECHSQKLMAAIDSWSSEERRAKAAGALSTWDVPEAVPLILAIIQEAVAAP